MGVSKLERWGTVAVVLMGSACAPRGDGRERAPDRTSAIGPEQALARTLADSLRDAGAKPDDPATCAVCHAAIAAEFEESLHRHAHHDRDPVYGALRAFRIGKEGPSVPGRCASCHSPRDVDAPDSEVARTGVSCVTCHALDGVILDGGVHGERAFVRSSPLLMRSGFDVDAGSSPLHETGPGVAALADGSGVCLTCHAEDRNAAGVVTCATGVELSEAKDTRSCVSCHLPPAAGPSGPVSTRSAHADHRFLGPHRAWAGDPSFFQSALKLGGRFEGARFVATVENTSGHSFPTGFPARLAVLVLRGVDASGAEVWRNVSGDPMKEHPEAVWNKVYAGADGGQTLAPYGVRIVRDARLKPSERREVAVEVPASVTAVEATVRFWLVAPMAAKAIGLGGPEAKPKDVLSARFTR